jgi:Family of unknown function (DUF6365)
MLSLSRMGFGEAILGLRLASELRSEGDEVFLLAHNSNAKLLNEFGAQCSTFGDVASPLLQLYISSCLKKFCASSIILSDYFAATYFFNQFRLQPEMLVDLGLPIFAIDTWGVASRSRNLGSVLKKDSSGRRSWPVVNPICPVPFLASEPWRQCYASLPRSVSVSSQLRQHVRYTLGITESHKAVLFCTAKWQHPDFCPLDEPIKRCATALPGLVADYLSRLGDKVHLVHVGHQPCDVQGRLYGRYHWVPPLHPQDFDTLLASMDLTLSANMSATTITKSMVFNVPAFVLQNSVSASTREEAESAAPDLLSDRMKRWLDQSLPLFPFILWPMDDPQNIASLFHNNPYTAALEIAEILDERRVETVLERLLFDASAREDQLHRQAVYVRHISGLPSGPQAIDAAWGNAVSAA